MGLSRNPVTDRQRSASYQKNAQSQRHRSLGNDAENRRVEAVSAEIVTPFNPGWLRTCRTGRFSRLISPWPPFLKALDAQSLGACSSWRSVPRAGSTQHKIVRRSRASIVASADEKVLAISIDRTCRDLAHLVKTDGEDAVSERI